LKGGHIFFMKNIKFYKPNIRKLIIGKTRASPFWVIAAIGIFSFDIARAMENEFAEVDGYISVKPMRDKQLEESIKLHAPQFVTPSRGQSVEVLQPSQPWQKWQSERWGSHPYELDCTAEEYVDGKRRFVDKWIIPSSILSVFKSSLVSFREDKTEAMYRQDAYKIMKYENDEITRLRQELYEVEISKFDPWSATYDGKTLDETRYATERPSHPKVYEEWKKADAKKKEIEKEKKQEEYRAEAKRSVAWLQEHFREQSEREEAEEAKNNKEYYISKNSINRYDTPDIVLSKLQNRSSAYNYNDDRSNAYFN